MTDMRGRKRTDFPDSVKKAAFRRCCQTCAVDGVENIPGVPQCENCGIALNARTGIIYEHRQPDGLGGPPTLDNCGVFCATCADIKTVSEDMPRINKADRVFKAHHGQKRRKGPPMPGSRASGFKRTIDGRTIRR